MRQDKRDKLIKDKTREAFETLHAFHREVHTVIEKIYDSMTAEITSCGIERQREIKDKIDLIGHCNIGYPNTPDFSRWLRDQLEKVAQERNDLP